MHISKYDLRLILWERVTRCLRLICFSSQGVGWSSIGTWTVSPRSIRVLAIFLGATMLWGDPMDDFCFCFDILKGTAACTHGLRVGQRHTCRHSGSWKSCKLSWDWPSDCGQTKYCRETKEHKKIQIPFFLFLFYFLNSPGQLKGRQQGQERVWLES